MIFHPNKKIPEEHFGVADAIRGYTSLERYPGGLSPDELASIQVHPNLDMLLEYHDWRPNLIVSSVANLISALFLGQSGYNGIQYVAVGSGEGDWDTDGTPEPTVGQTDLVNELGRVAPTVVFLDSSNNSTSAVTNRLQVSGTFMDADAVGTWREWGVFGGNATSAADSGLLINYRTHGATAKPNDETLVRRVRFVF